MPYETHRDRRGRIKRYQVPQRNPKPQDYTASEQPYWDRDVDDDRHGDDGFDQVAEY